MFLLNVDIFLLSHCLPLSLKIKSFALAGVAQWIECWPGSQRVTSLISSQGTCLGCGSGPQQGAHERQPHIDVFFSLPENK